ncbi:YbhB/YbcL family Raf kinase inhibitor-like protein [Agarivorans sp. JK6]|uniref:YbhB/YbcL family Raf kinase inhibitor-like protein n=2 Tax=Agarivorans TaxID=261825 RepID=UPI0038736DCA
MRALSAATVFFSLIGCNIAMAESLSLSSNDVSHGELMSKQHEFVGFGCSGGNMSPQLSWKNPPKGTKSFAITAYDPDAPTGSGWWHWQVVNIPLSTRSLASNAGSVESEILPSGSRQIENDYGVEAFGGACPPKGHGIHRYRFTLHALSVEKLDLPARASGALAGYMINANTLESSTIEALYQRE